MPTRIILALMLSLLVLPAFAQDDIDQLRLKAEQGDAEAQFNLGVMYDDGRGVPQDYIQAHMWYNLSASNRTGDKRDIAVSDRDRVAEKMPPEDISEAQRLASEWQSKK